METKIKNLPKSELEIEFELSAEEFAKFYSEAISHLSGSLKIDGFRPGKVPKNIVEEKIGNSHILEHAAQDAVRHNYVAFLEEKNIFAISHPEISVLKLAKDNPFVFKAKFAVLPEVKLPDYQKIAKSIFSEKKEMTVETNELDDALKYLRNSRAKHVTVTRPAQMGDQIEIDFIARLDGVIIEGGQSKNHPLVLGQSRFVKGFEENLVGLKECEEKKFSLVFPEDYYKKELAGRSVDFEVKVVLVQEVQLPEFNDEFAKNLGQFDTAEALKNNVKEGIKHEKEHKEKDRLRRQAIEEVAKKATMEIPEILIDKEIEKMMAEFKDGATQMGLGFEEYLVHLKKSEADLKSEWRDQAINRVRVSLCLREIANKEKIDASESEIEEESNKILKQFQSVDQAQKSFDINALKDYTRSILKNEKVFEYLEKNI